MTATRPGIRKRHEIPRGPKEPRTEPDGQSGRQNAVIREAINKNGENVDGVS